VQVPSSFVGVTNVVMCSSVLYSAIVVQCTATITRFIYGILVDEPRSGESDVVRDIANGLVDCR
jgi:hypothetical protein